MTSNKINYISEVTASLIAHCHDAAVLNANDFAIIAEWEKEEIPLAVVLRSINESCGGSQRNNLSIADLQKKVDDEFSKWLQTSPT